MCNYFKRIWLELKFYFSFKEITIDKIYSKRNEVKSNITRCFIIDTGYISRKRMLSYSIWNNNMLDIDVCIRTLYMLNIDELYKLSEALKPDAFALEVTYLRVKSMICLIIMDKEDNEV